MAPGGTQRIAHHRASPRAKLDKPRAVYSDLTRVGFVGETVPEKYESIFQIVAVESLGLDEAEQVLESKAQNELIFTDEVKTNGLFTISDTLVEETIKTLGVAGIKMTAEKLFDQSLLQELYASKPDLKAGLA